MNQGLNPRLLNCRQILYHLSHQGNPNTHTAAKVGMRLFFPALQAGNKIHCALPSYIFLWLFSCMCWNIASWNSKPQYRLLLCMLKKFILRKIPAGGNIIYILFWEEILHNRWMGCLSVSPQNSVLNICMNTVIQGIDHLTMELGFRGSDGGCSGSVSTFLSSFPFSCFPVIILVQQRLGLSNYVTLGKSFLFSGPQFPHL